ncbi:MAG TPA: hypothetical protein PKI19_05985 [Elusimicrobiales bacterium]|nr:hypothetical protein [Elusimicrobiales bacterium]
MMNDRVFLLLPAALLLAACGSLPRAEKIQVPPYLSVRIDHQETLGEYLVITPSFKVLVPDTSRERVAYLETQVAEFDNMKLFKGTRFGADRTLPTNDKKAVAEDLAKYGKTTKVVPAALTISAKFISGKVPRIVVTATPNILDSSGALHFSLEEQLAPGGAKSVQARNPADAAPAPETLPPGKKAASIKAYLLQKYGKTFQLKRSGTVLSAAGKPVAGIEVELTFYLENARISFNGIVKNLSKQKLWATSYFPQLTYHKGRDWFTFTSRQFAESLKGREMQSYLIAGGTEKKFQFTTDAELQVLVYDAAQNKIAARNAFSSKDEDDLLKFEILEKYLSGSPDVPLEVFPNRIICADCGVKLY